MIKILVIEDEQPLREEILEWLQFEGYETYGAAYGLEGIQRALEHLPDLIISDVLMPGMDGYQVLIELRTFSATVLTPFIFLTALSDREDIRHGMNLGADDYLTKPFTRAELLEAIRARLEKYAINREQAAIDLDELRTRVIHALPVELRNPITAIIGFGDLLRCNATALSTPERLAAIGNGIIRSGERLQHLIYNYLLYVQLELRPDPLSPAGREDAPTSIILRVARQLAAHHQRADDLQLQLTDAAVAIAGEYLETIITELIDNAFKFSASGDPVHVTCRRQDNRFVITVQDRGCGIAADRLPYLGAAGWQARAAHDRQGVGLGLILVRRLAEIHGGKLTITSQLRVGATAQIQLPLAGQGANG